jgi:hypothetical protein
MASATKHSLEPEEHAHIAEPRPAHAMRRYITLCAMSPVGLSGGRSHQSFVTSPAMKIWLNLAPGLRLTQKSRKPATAPVLMPGV